MNQITKAEMREKLSNITQLQELLFGEQINEYNHKLEQHSQRLNQLEGNSQKFQFVIEERIARLESNLIHKINSIANSLERKIKYLNLTTKEEQSNIRQELEAVSRHSHDNIDFLQNSLNSHTNGLKTEITQSKAALDRDLQLLKQQISEKLESNLSDLSNNKVSCTDLAEVLFELCLKLKGEDELELPAPQEQQENQTVDLMLPETT
ncbi:hypothetical protein IQ255_24735 [Pleurocapsales cyanobacterium LEGE 10410]|nr:hypothetical protein [Pleurocapsales cyanobacterium LEGE 10410]